MEDQNQAQPAAPAAEPAPAAPSEVLSPSKDQVEGSAPAPETAAAPPPDELAEARAKAEEYLAGWKRAMADYANLKKETEKQREEFFRYACAGLVSELLPVIDAFRKAAAAEPKPGDANAAGWIEGIGRIRQQLDGVMRKLGLKAIDATGIPFDPLYHEAMMTRKEEGAESGRVVQILEAGYQLHDKVLRAAKVTVAE